MNITKTPFSRTFLRCQINSAAHGVIGAFLASGLLLTPISQSRADTPALTATGGTDANGRDTTSGFVFTLSVPLLITSLGVYDGPSGTGGSVGDGLAAAHKITIWTEGQVALATATVPLGTTATLNGSFRYVSISPLLLPIGTYVIGAYYPDTPSFLDVLKTGATIATASGVTYTDSAGAAGDGFPPPANFPQREGFFGPNFLFTSVPEAGTSALLLLGAASILALRAFRRRQDGSGL